VESSSDDRDALERDVRKKLLLREIEDAATLVLRGYGPEIFGFLTARLRDESAAGEAFSMFTEDLWRGLPGFEGRASVRVWAYTLARHAAIRYQASPHLRRERNLPLHATEALSKLEARVRTDTAPFLKTEFKTRIAELRARLSEDDRTLLVLRIDRGLDWTDVARVFLAPESDASDRTMAAEAARLRKRFQLVKSKIRRMAKESGLVADTEDEPGEG
jgi:RNA polymerase sigma-70 factor (ECF subfamily)